MRSKSEPPSAHQAFVKRYPKLGQAWDLTAQAGAEGPLDERTLRLVKLGVALGALREGAVHSAVRKAVAVGVSPREIDQVIALAASTLGFPATVAVDTWVRDLPAGRSRSRKRR